MPLTPQEKQSRHLQMFGVNDMEAVYNERAQAPFFSPQIFAQSLLSDAQEEIERGMDEQARRHINMAKWVIAYKLKA